MNGTIAIKIDETLRARLKGAAALVGRTPHWLARQGVIAAIERAERGERFEEADGEGASAPAGDGPFLGFVRDLAPQSALRARITAATRMPEAECVPLLIAGASLAPDEAERARSGRARWSRPCGRRSRPGASMVWCANMRCPRRRASR